MLLFSTYDFFLWMFARLSVRRPNSFLPPPLFTQGFSFNRALVEQPTVTMLSEPYATRIPVVLFLIGQLFVLSSTWALGITGTFLGDYFGILMDHRVEGFPFNVLRDPMYVGSTMCFAATALWYQSLVGLMLTLYVYIVYVIALRFEG